MKFSTVKEHHLVQTCRKAAAEEASLVEEKLIQCSSHPGTVHEHLQGNLTPVREFNTCKGIYEMHI